MRHLHQPYDVARTMNAHNLLDYYLDFVDELDMIFGAFGVEKKQPITKEFLTNFKHPESWVKDKTTGEK